MSDRIDSIIDLISIQGEIDKVKELTGQLAATLKDMPKAKIQIDNATNDKEISAVIKQQKVDLNELKIKNAELAAAIKERNLAAKQAAAQAKEAAAQAKAQAQAAKEQAAAEKELARQAQIASQEKLRLLKEQQKAEEELAQVQKKRSESEVGTFDISQGSGQGGTAGLKRTAVKEAAFVPANATEENLLFLTKTETALKANQAAQKDLGTQLKNNEISQEQYNAKIVEARAAELEYKKQIQLTNAELKARTNADFAIQGSIDAAKAENALLIPQRNAIAAKEGIATPEDIAQIKALNAEIDKNNELIDKNNDLLGRQKINIGNYPNAFGGAFKTLNSELDKVQGKLVSGNFGGESLDQLTAKMNVLQNATKLTGQEFTSTAAQAAAHKEAAIQIGQVYGKDSEVFKTYASQVKEGAVQNAKLATEVSSVAVKGKGFLGFLSLAYSGIRKLAYAIPGMGIAGVIALMLGPLQAAGAALVKWSNAATKSGRDFKDLEEHIKNTNAIIDKSADSFGKATSEVKKLTNDVQLAKQGLLDQDKVLKEYNDTMGKTTGHLKNFDQLEAKLIADGPDYIKLLFLKAEATSAYALAGEAARKALTAQTDAEKDFGAIDFIASNKWNLFKNAFGFGIGDAGVNAVKQIDKNAADIKKEQEKAFKDFSKQGDDFQKQAAELAKKHGWNFFVKKSREDSERLLDQFRKKDLEALSKFSNGQLRIIQEHNKQMAGFEKLSLEERLGFEQKYYDASLKLLENEKKTQTDALNLETDTALKNAKKIKNSKLRAETDIAIEKFRTDQLKNIDQKFSDDSLKLNQSLYDDNVQIAEQAFEKIRKLDEENSKFIQGQQKITFQNQKDKIDISKDEKLLQLEKDLAGGRIKNIEQYNRRREDIESAADIEQKQLDLQRLQDSEKIFEALYGVQNLDFIRQAKDIEVEIEQAGNKKILESQKELNDKKKEFARDLADFIQTGLLAQNQNQQDQLDEDSKKVDERSQKQIDAINASTLAEADKQKRITAIEKQAAFDHEQIQLKQDKLDKQRKTIQRLAAIAEVGAGIVKSVFDLQTKAAAARAEGALLASNPFTAAFAPAAFIAAGSISAQIPFVLASGALALMKAAAFKKGTKNAPKGPALVSEEGPELVVDKHGNMFLTPAKPSLIDLAGGEKIFRADETEKILSHYNLLSMIQKVQSAKEPVRVNEYNEKIYRELRSLNGKPPFIIQVQNGMETTDYYMRNIKN